MKKGKNLLNLFGLIFVLAGTLQAQFADAVTPILLGDTQFREKTGDTFTLSGTSIPYDTSEDIEGAAIRFSSETTPEVYFQFKNESGTWSLSIKADLFPEPYSNRYIASTRNGRVKGSIGFRYRISVEGGEVVVLYGGLMKRYLEEVREIIPPSYPKKTGDVDKPKIISRAEWGARPPQYDYSDHPYFDKLTLHHAAGWAARSLEEGKRQVKSIQTFHQDGRGWSDIGYHFVVDMAGNIYQGRPETVLGAHVGGANTGNIGVCILGCYHPPEQGYSCNDEMTEDTEEALIHLYAWISDTYGVDPKVLLGHRDYFPGSTSCPGDNVWPLIPQMRADIALYIEFGLQPTHFALYQNYPNPFNPKTTLHFDLPQDLYVSLKIYDIAGREIRTLVDGPVVSGYKTVQWDGKDDGGEAVPSGIYLYTVEMGSFSSTKKMVLLK